MTAYHYYALPNSDVVYRYPAEDGNGFGEWRAESSLIGWITTGTQPATLLAHGARRLQSPPDWVVTAG